MSAPAPPPPGRPDPAGRRLPADVRQTHAPSPLPPPPAPLRRPRPAPAALTRRRGPAQSLPILRRCGWHGAPAPTGAGLVRVLWRAGGRGAAGIAFLSSSLSPSLSSFPPFFPPSLSLSLPPSGEEHRLRQLFPLAPLGPRWLCLQAKHRHQIGCVSAPPLAAPGGRPGREGGTQQKKMIEKKCACSSPAARSLQRGGRRTTPGTQQRGTHAPHSPCMRMGGGRAAPSRSRSRRSRRCSAARPGEGAERAARPGEGLRGGAGTAGRRRRRGWGHLLCGCGA